MLKLSTRKKNKFGAKKTEVDGIVFDSKKEARYYQQLITLERTGAISDLIHQPRFDFLVDGQKIFTYIADFQYTDTKTKSINTVDVKGYKKGCAYQLFKLKKKLIEAQHKITIEEV